MRRSSLMLQSGTECRVLTHKFLGGDTTTQKPYPLETPKNWRSSKSWQCRFDLLCGLYATPANRSAFGSRPQCPIGCLLDRRLLLHPRFAQFVQGRRKIITSIGRMVVPKSIFRFLHRVGRRLANGRLRSARTYTGIGAFMRSQLVKSRLIDQAELILYCYFVSPEI